MVFELDTKDMQRHEVELRMFMDKARRRFAKANLGDVFERIVKGALPDDEDAGPNKLQLDSVGSQEEARRLGAFLDRLVEKCIHLEQHRMLEDTLRDKLQRSRRKCVIEMQGQAEPMCYFCASGLESGTTSQSNENQDNIAPHQPTEQPLPVFTNGHSTALRFCLEPDDIADDEPLGLEPSSQQQAYANTNGRTPFAHVPNLLNPPPPLTPPASVNPTPDPGKWCPTPTPPPLEPVNLAQRARRSKRKAADAEEIEVVKTDTSDEEPQDLSVGAPKRATNASQQLKQKQTQKRKGKANGNRNGIENSYDNIRIVSESTNTVYDRIDADDNVESGAGASKPPGWDHEDSLPGLFIDEDYDTLADIESARSSTPLALPASSQLEEKKDRKKPIKRKRTEKRNSSSKQFKQTAIPSDYSIDSQRNK